MNHNWVFLSGTNARYSFERKEDGRWIAILECVPGAMAYGETPELAEKALDALVCKIACEGAAAIAAADHAATERACAAVCWMCKDTGNWAPAEQTPEEFMDECQPPIWGHRPRPHYEGKTEWAFRACDAEKIRQAAAQEVQP